MSDDPDWIDEIVRRRCAAKDREIASLREALAQLQAALRDCKRYAEDYNDGSIPHLVDVALEEAPMNDALFFAIGDLFEGKAADEVIPVLIVASARACVTQSGPDKDYLEKVLTDFCAMMRAEAKEMYDRESASLKGAH